MTQPDTRDHQADEGLLTPAASAVAGLVLAILGLGGDGLWTLAASAVVGSSFGDMGPVLVVSGGTSLLVALGALWLGRRGMTADGPGTAWGPHVARAAVLLAVLGVALSVLTLVGGLVDRPFWPGY